MWRSYYARAIIPRMDLIMMDHDTALTCLFEEADIS